MVLIDMNKPPKIVFLCKRNIVRSYFAEVVFSALYPDFKFNSAGLISSEADLDLSWRKNLLETWGFSDPERRPKSFELVQHEIVDGDVIVLLDSELPELLTSYVLENPGVTVLNSFNQFPEWAFTFDPLDMGSSEIKLAVSRVLFTTHKLLWNTLNLPISKTTAIFWQSVESFHEEIMDYCHTEIANGNNILFLEPCSSDYISSSIFNLNPIDLSNGRPSISNGPAIWMPEYEYPFIEKLLLSTDWSATIADSANVHPLKVISGPLRDGNRYLTLPLLIGSFTRNYEIRESTRKDLRPTPL